MGCRVGSQESVVSSRVHGKGGDGRPLYVTGEVGLAFFAGLLLPALHLLRHCLLSPPSCGFGWRERSVIDSMAAAWHAHAMRRSSLRGIFRARKMRSFSDTRNGFSSPSSYQM